MATSLVKVGELKGHQASVCCIEYARQSFLGDHVLASGSEDATCRIWDLRSGKVIKGIHNLKEAVGSVAFANKPDLPHFYLASGNQIHIYDLRNTAMILTTSERQYEFSGDEINSIDMHPKKNFLASGDDCGEVKVVDLDNHKIYKQIKKKHQSICMAVKFRSRKPWEVWSGGLDSKVYKWDFSRGTPMDVYDMASEPVKAQMFNPPFVYSLETSPDDAWIAAGSGDASIHLISNTRNRDAPTQLILENGHTTMVTALAFLEPTEEYPVRLISGSANASLAYWQISSAQISGAPIIAKPLQLDPTMTKLNSLQVYELDNQAYIAAAGVGSSATTGLIHIYELP
ncbi:WD40-repeat-containing domain protein [Radiomyces spectabilis]|uniref:WD40-repeat-containing domain protein n=1 Tax=Radiomyces spectabilis TaxID=64574 RepID=UPI00221F97B7|nr:WD40-repeat-containing domain protein [Radiomyces spectabilis]KAI8376254.1 WD40-repeat-containing domain protein [Radiomyces spectabilis]